MGLGGGFPASGLGFPRFFSTLVPRGILSFSSPSLPPSSSSLSAFSSLRFFASSSFQPRNPAAISPATMLLSRLSPSTSSLLAPSRISNTLLALPNASTRGFAKETGPKLTGAQKAAQKAVAQRKKEAREAKKKAKAKLMTQKKTKRKKEAGPRSIHEIPPPRPLRRTKDKPVIEHVSVEPRIPQDPIIGERPSETDLIKLWKKEQRSRLTHDRAHVHAIFPEAYGAFMPTMPMSARFAKVFDAYLGNPILPSFTKEAPQVWWAFDEDADDLHTLALVDLDAPGAGDKSGSPFLHWLVTNIPDNLVDQGTTLADYVQALPSKGTGVHRLALMLFVQKGGLVNQEKAGIARLDGQDLQRRARFSLQDFAKKNKLAAKGLLFFRAEWDDSVTQFYNERNLQEPVYVLASSIRAPPYVVPGRRWL